MELQVHVQVVLILAVLLLIMIQKICPLTTATIKQKLRIGNFDLSRLTDDDVEDCHKQMQKIHDQIHDEMFLMSVENVANAEQQILRRNFNRIKYMTDLSLVVLFWTLKNIESIF
eukprot:UN02798